MVIKKKWIILLGAGFFLFLSGSLRAGYTSLSKFRGVEIPVDLKHGDSIIEKGKYDLEVFAAPIGSGTGLFMLEIKRKNETLCQLPGEKIEYETDLLQELRKDPDIPEKPSLKMRKISSQNMLIFMFESGKKSRAPFLKVKFQIEYQETP